MNRLQTLAINSTGFAFDPMHGESFTISETGIFIISELNRGTDIQQIVEMMAREYQVDSEQCYTDVLEFYNRLKFFSLVES